MFNYYEGNTKKPSIMNCYNLPSRYMEKTRGLPRGQRSDLDIVEPGLHGLEALLHCDVVHQHHAVCLAKELLGYAAVPASMTV